MHNVSIYVIFWLPNGSSYVGFQYGDHRYERLILRFFGDLGGSSFYNIVTQYGDAKGFPLNTTRLAASYNDTTLYPGEKLDPTEVEDTVLRAMTANGWHAGLDSVFFVFTGAGANVQGFNSRFCAYHNHFEHDGEQVVYAYMPSLFFEDVIKNCGVGSGRFSPNYNYWADSEINLASHELFEAVTDPLFTGWGPADNEVGDRCNFAFGPISDSNSSDLVLKGHGYVVQKEWSNRDMACVLSEPGRAPPIASRPTTPLTKA